MNTVDLMYEYYNDYCALYNHLLDKGYTEDKIVEIVEKYSNELKGCSNE